MTVPSTAPAASQGSVSAWTHPEPDPREVLGSLVPSSYGPRLRNVLEALKGMAG